MRTEKPTRNFRKCPKCGGKLVTEQFGVKFHQPSCEDCFFEPFDRDFQNNLEVMGLKRALKFSTLEMTLGGADSEEEWDQADKDWRELRATSKAEVEKLEARMAKLKRELEAEKTLLGEVEHLAKRWNLFKEEDFLN